MNLQIFFISLVFILIVDFLWLGVIASGFYRSRLTKVGRFENGQLKVIYWAGLVVYLLLAAGVTFYVLPLVQNTDSLLMSFAYGAGYGLLTYGVYDFTNKATLKEWPISLMAVDVLWGGLVVGMTTCLARYAQLHFL